MIVIDEATATRRLLAARAPLPCLVEALRDAGLPLAEVDPVEEDGRGHDGLRVAFRNGMILVIGWWRGTASRVARWTWRPGDEPTFESIAYFPPVPLGDGTATVELHAYCRVTEAPWRSLEEDGLPGEPPMTVAELVSFARELDAVAQGPGLRDAGWN